MDFNDVYNDHLIKSKTANEHLFGSKIQNQYFSYLPDRYFLNLSTYQKSTNFLDFNNLQSWIAGNYDNNIGDLGRFFFLNLCIDYLLEEKIQGNVAELGVYKGNSAVLLAKYAARVNTTCYLFDTFEGFDERDLVNLDLAVQKDRFSDTDIPSVKKIVGNDQSVEYIKGYFPDSLAGQDISTSFSLVHIDCDLEKPFMEALNYFYPKLIDGGFLIMHDHSSLFWPGAKKAIDSFFYDKPESIIPIPDKSGTCVIRKT